RSRTSCGSGRANEGRTHSEGTIWRGTDMRERLSRLLLIGGLLLASGIVQMPGRAATAADEPPQLPGYFTGTSADPAKPTWPDPTGGATGVWATPAGDAKGDVPGALSITDVYDRVAHNLYSINFVWTLVAGFLVMFMQAGFMLVETGLCRA